LDPRARECRLAMRNATDYATWREAATAFDRVTGREDWKQEESSELYDWKLIKNRLRHIRQLRQEGQVGKLVHHLRQGLYWNLGNMSNAALYGHALVGTKQLIHDYVAEVVAALDHLCDGDFPEFDTAAKRRFFEETASSYGRSALMLSGGATLGLFHVGVVKALVLEDLLPEVISGSSAGSVVASTIGTRTPEELIDLLDPKNAYYHFWKPLSLSEMWRRGVLMDQRQIRKAIAANIPDLTFEESYQRSGRVINITVSPAGSNQSPRLLNYLTFPYLYLREAVLASSAVPFLFEPVLLMTRDENGKRVPYMPSLRWTDGSLRSDLPGLRLRRLHNVNHFIVSQTNPHVIPFVRGSLEDQGFLGNLRDAGYSLVRGTAKYAIGVGRFSVPVQKVRHTLDYASSILDQDYRGNIMIVPKLTVWRYANVTANPKMEAVKRFIREGERATWKRIEMVRNQFVISQTLERCLRRLEPQRLGRNARPELARKPNLSVVRRSEP
jgi:TAG lipase / steryl ester hydrolase / phospholipase A2 / LPA acyltransferase